MYLQHNLIQDLDGNFQLTMVQDNTALAAAVSAEKAETGGWTEERTMKKMLSVPPQVYHEYAQQYGAECWQDDDFLKFFAAHRPEFAY